MTMRSRRGRVMCAAAVAALVLCVDGLQAQVSVDVHIRPWAANVIVPQSRSFVMHRAVAAPRAAAVQITGVKVGVVIVQQAATTTMDISLRNPGPRREEAELLVPVPDGAAVRGFTFEGAAKEPTAQLLPKDEARRAYNAIVAKTRDPALLEFVGFNLVRSSVFPVEAGGTQKVRLTYEHLLTADGDRVDYFLPRTEQVAYTVPWDVSVRITSKRNISTVYSPSHQLETTRKNGNVVQARIAPAARTEPGAFRLSYLLEKGGVSASLMAYPDPKINGGYFLLLAGLPARPPKRDDGPAIKREVTLVIDHSGSMRGEKIEQVREAALQVLAGLDDGEPFNVIAYSNAVEPLFPKPVAKNAGSMRRAGAYLKALKATGGTNIHDAIMEALRQKPAAGMLPIVLFLTDGLPTVGQTSLVAIRNVAMKANPHKRRIFTFGVGVDVNAPLLDRVAAETRATATYVLPKEDVEVKVAGVFKRLSGPILAEPRVSVARPDGSAAPPPAHDIMPRRLPDLFDGDQLVLLGKYRGDQPLAFRLTGNYLGRERTFRFEFTLAKATVRNGFVPRLWASRRIGVLLDAIRQLGADDAPTQTARVTRTDPRMRELVDEIVRLSTEFGILTEYTAFLAREGTDLSQRDQILALANRNFERRAIRTRSGTAAVNQAVNNGFYNGQQVLNGRNRFFDENMNTVTVSSVQQINDRAFYFRNGRWVDSRVVEQEGAVKPDQVITFGSPEFRKLVERLAKEGRLGTVSLDKDVLMKIDDKAVLLKSVAAE